MNKIKVGIINVTGYAGVELARILWQHPGSRRVKLRVTGGEREPVWILPSQEFRVNAQAEAALAPWIAGR